MLSVAQLLSWHQVNLLWSKSVGEMETSLCLKTFTPIVGYMYLGRGRGRTESVPIHPNIKNSILCC